MARHFLHGLGRLSIWTLACAMLAGLSRAADVPASRVALVIGNARYESEAGPLRNTVNDAKAVAQTLRALGFSVTERSNVTRDQLLRAVDDFRRRIGGAEVAVFYYAGHGISVAGANYLVPLKSGFDPEGADGASLRVLAETRLFNAEQAVADMDSAGASCNLIILDACRNTPLARNSRDRNLASTGGLSEMTPPAGSLIAFATDAGQTAFDGDGKNGLYTEELLKHLRTPGLTIEQVFKRTRAGVVRRSGGSQIPAEYSRLIGDDIFLAGEAAPRSAPETRPPPAAPTAKDILALAKSGRTAESLAALEKFTASPGAAEETAPLIDAVLESVKDDLKTATGPSPAVTAATSACETILEMISRLLPGDSVPARELAAKAHNRRGDALLLLNRPKEAIATFDAAAELDKSDSYILYNRGRAYLALDLPGEARADFTAAADPRFDQPRARKLALKALEALPPSGPE